MQIHTQTVDKKIAVGLVGYESKQEIARCLDPWIGHVDCFILGDGKFSFYDAKNDYSEDGWLDFAEKRYKDKVEFAGYQYAGDQVKKRQRYLDIAGKLNCDFLIAVDTDEYIDPLHADWPLFYKNLVKVSEALPDDRMFFQWIWIPSEKEWPKQGNKFPSNTWRKSIKIHKDPGSMRFCCNSHFQWCPSKVTDDEIYQWQFKHPDDENPLVFKCRNTIEGVRVRMDRRMRTKYQIRKGAEWAWLNNHEEQMREYCQIQKIMKNTPPPGFNTWDQYADSPHTFNIRTGRRIEL